VVSVNVDSFFRRNPPDQRVTLVYAGPDGNQTQDSATEAGVETARDATLLGEELEADAAWFVDTRVVGEPQAQRRVTVNSVQYVILRVKRYQGTTLRLLLCGAQHAV
jgi:hypothetical protein